MLDTLYLLSKYFYYKPKQLNKILENFKEITDVISEPREAFLKLGLNGSTLDRFLLERSSTKIEFNFPGISIVTILDKSYPKQLKNIFDAPPILFYKGDLACLDSPTLAVVGSRRITEYGKRVTEDFVKRLCKHFVIISGLAYGVDGLAHKITVQNQEKTIAVLGSGLDEISIYPKANVFLGRSIIEVGGLLLTEIPPGVGPQAFHFPMRNRIISALSQGILIIEGGQKSGTLITAKLGLDYSKDIFAVPNSIYSENSKGVNFLIKCGAHAVTVPEDILEFYGIEKNTLEQKYIPQNNKEKLIFEVLSSKELTIDEIGEFTKIPLTDLMVIITDLEISGIVKNNKGKYFIF